MEHSLWTSLEDNGGAAATPAHGSAQQINLVRLVFRLLVLCSGNCWSMAPKQGS